MILSVAAVSHHAIINSVFRFCAVRFQSTAVTEPETRTRTPALVLNQHQHQLQLQLQLQHQAAGLPEEGGRDCVRLGEVRCESVVERECGQA